MDLFDSADFYDRGDGGELRWTTPEEALEDALQYAGDLYANITIYAWKRRILDEGTSKQWATNLLETLENCYLEDEELSDPDDASIPIDNTIYDGIKLSLFSAVAEFSKNLKPWGCEEVAKRTYTTEEIRALFPHFYEENSDETE